ncbi:MAG TPA: hypothetical protein VIJ85_01205 [Rhizomicrobium sp.]
MQMWLPVLATLAGAAVTGAIAIILARLANKHAIRVAKLHMNEERARWAAERWLERLQKFYGTVESLITAAENFRIQQAWDANPLPDGYVPPWILSYNDARGGLEDALARAGSEISLLDDDIRAEYVAAQKKYHEWFMAKTKDASVQALAALEGDLIKFKDSLAARYRQVFDARRSGADLSG